jgi:ClpP class serine protease
LIKDRLKANLTTKRQVPPEVVEQFGNKLIHPKKALELKLVDKIGSLNEYKN